MIKLTWKDKIRSWIGIKLFKIIGIRSGPAMIAIQGEWLFIDFKGYIYNIRPTFDYEGTPLIISLLRK